MEILVEQGSREWKKLRRSLVTATDATVVMQTNHYKTLYKLWCQKLMFMPDDEVTPPMQRGLELEPQARRKASEILGVSLSPKVFVSDSTPFMMASLDGVHLKE